jgi:dimethylhistidine N-methyltransferase
MEPDAAELENVLAGLRQARPRLSPRYLYDARGSRLFDEITRTPEYYPSRVELGLLRERGQRIAARVGRGCALIELGSGSADKALALLAHLDTPRVYRPIDISREALDRTTAAVQSVRPDLEVSPHWGDFMCADAYANLPAEAQRLVYYSGSTIGNFEPSEAVACLRGLRARLASGDFLLLAADLVKDVQVLHAAYNDRSGVTAAFNKNVLSHLNARFGGDFDPDAFVHRAFYDARKRRIEMHLAARSEQVVTLGAQRLRFVPERPIHTESSYKFSTDELRSLATSAGFVPEDVIVDERSWFAEAVLRVP